jgi:hypothetical protein
MPRDTAWPLLRSVGAVSRDSGDDGAAHLSRHGAEHACPHTLVVGRENGRDLGRSERLETTTFGLARLRSAFSPKTCCRSALGSAAATIAGPIQGPTKVFLEATHRAGCTVNRGNYAASLGRGDMIRTCDLLLPKRVLAFPSVAASGRPCYEMPCL